MLALILKELRSFFSALTGYVAVGTFLVLLGLFLWVFPGEWNVLDGGIATLEGLFVWAPWVLMLLVPAITMRSIAEERKTGTLELLLTRPLGEGAIVVAKFLGALSVLLVALLPTLAYVGVIGSLGSPAWNLDLGGTWGSYFGLVLLGATLIGIGILTSALTSNPLVAFLTALVISVFLYTGFTALGDFGTWGEYDRVFRAIGLEPHYRSMSRGLIEPGDVAYFGCAIALTLLGARWALQRSRGHRRADAISFGLSSALAATLALAFSWIPGGLDLTAEKRFTLTPATRTYLTELTDDVVVTCYLTGSFPAEWKRLEQAIRTQLEQFADVSGGRVRYQFVDIYASDDPKTIGENEERLYEQGLRFTRIAYDEAGTQAFRTVWPAALISFRGREVPVQFFRSDMPAPSDEMIQGSINTVEFELVTGLRRASRQERPQIAFLEGHGELLEWEVADWVSTLAEDYDVHRVRLDGKLNALAERLEGMRYRTNRFDLVVIAKPDSTFSPKDQLILDQFLMNGGRVLWLTDALSCNLDSLAKYQATEGLALDLGIHDLLFNYGVRLNRNLVIDAQCAPIVLDAGPMGNQRNMQMFNWYFAPVAILQGISHPITTNLDPVHLDFVSRLDTVNTQPAVRKTVLMRSSELAREYKAPVRISSGIVTLKPEYFAERPLPHQPFAVLLEGEFRSAFADNISDTLRRNEDFAFREQSERTGMVVIGDGDIARNKVRTTPEGPQMLPLGYDRYAGRVIYDNKEFLLNTVSYLLDEESTISVRSRAIALRPLDEERVRAGRTGYQTLAVAVPLVVLAAIGAVFTALRRRRFGRPQSTGRP